jgi:hypothetical protein
MLFLSMPLTFKVGDTAECKINGEPTQVSWPERATLVIDPHVLTHGKPDTREILDITVRGNLRSFTCADEEGDSDITIIRP